MSNDSNVVDIAQRELEKLLDGFDQGRDAFVEGDGKYTGYAILIFGEQSSRYIIRNASASDLIVEGQVLCQHGLNMLQGG